MKYTLYKESKGNKGDFLYTVKDETGKTISDRVSKRDYVACTKFGSNYFGRLDLAMRFVANEAKRLADWRAPSAEQVKEWRDRNIYREDYITGTLMQPPSIHTLEDIAFLETK